MGMGMGILDDVRFFEIMRAHNSFRKRSRLSISIILSLSLSLTIISKLMMSSNSLILSLFSLFLSFLKHFFKIFKFPALLSLHPIFFE